MTIDERRPHLDTAETREKAFPVRFGSYTPEGRLTNADISGMGIQTSRGPIDEAFLMNKLDQKRQNKIRHLAWA